MDLDDMVADSTEGHRQFNNMESQSFAWIKFHLRNEFTKEIGWQNETGDAWKDEFTNGREEFMEGTLFNLDFNEDIEKNFDFDF